MNPSETPDSSRPARSRPGASGRGRWRRYLPFALGAALLAAVIVALRPKPVHVETAVVTRGPLTVSVLEEGKTRIRHRYVVSPPVAGFLNRVDLRAGAPIEAGRTVLATIEPEPPVLLDPRTRAQAEARVKAAESARMFRDSELQRARAALDLAEKEFARAEALRETGVISSQEWDAAENRVRILSREVHAAEFSLQVAGFEVTQAEAALMQSAPPEEGSSRAIRMVAPVDGFVLNVHEENARVILPGQPIMEVGDPRDLEAEIELLSSDAVAVQPGAEVSIEHWGGDAPLRGRVSLVERGGFTKISALGVEEQRVKVRVDFLDPFPPGHELGDRYRVEARIVTWNDDDVLRVPTGALFRRGGDWMTFAIEGGRARLRKVGIAHNNGIMAEVQSGLSEGDEVILYVPDLVYDGVRVTGDR
ncbi:MAG TPA: HlyD family efflux transporter periplasmic adaptor subunit [Opitutaceae bacterium]